MYGLVKIGQVSVEEMRNNPKYTANDWYKHDLTYRGLSDEANNSNLDYDYLNRTRESRLNQEISAMKDKGALIGFAGGGLGAAGLAGLATGLSRGNLSDEAVSLLGIGSTVLGGGIGGGLGSHLAKNKAEAEFDTKHPTLNKQNLSNAKQQKENTEQELFDYMNEMGYIPD
jgi:hypothetical protein